MLFAQMCDRTFGGFLVGSSIRARRKYQIFVIFFSYTQVFYKKYLYIWIIYSNFAAKIDIYMEAITFSPAQVHVFNLVSHIKSAVALEQLREQLAAFYAQKVDEEMDQLWKSGEWNEQKLDSLRGSHFRTPYNV